MLDDFDTNGLEGPQYDLIRNWDIQLERNKGNRVKAALGILRCSQHAHMLWRDWLIRNPREPDEHNNAEDVSPNFHQRCIDEYTQIIQVIEDLASLVGGVPEPVWSPDDHGPGFLKELTELCMKYGWGIGASMDGDYPRVRLLQSMTDVPNKDCHYTVDEESNLIWEQHRHRGADECADDCDDE